MLFFVIYKCRFKASWTNDSYDDNYRAIIDIDNIPVRVSKEIVKLANKIERQLRKQANIEKRKELALAKEKTRKIKIEEQAVVNTLKNFTKAKRK